MDASFTIPLWLDLIAVGVGAVQGAMFASGYRDAELDLLGVAIVGIASGFGGGIVRDLLLSRELAALQSDWYIVVATAASLVGMLIAHRLRRVEGVITALDALTIGAFGAIGTTTALSMGLPWVPAIFIGVASAVGGSIMRDVLLHLPIQLMHVGSLYAVAAAAGGASIVALVELGVDVSLSGLVGVTVTTVIRMLSVLLGWKLPAQTQLRRGMLKNR